MEELVEKQKINKWIILSVILFSVIYIFYKVHLETSKKDLIITSLILICNIILFMVISLKTQLTKSEISYQFSPFHFKKRGIKSSEIKKITIEKSKYWIEFGGIGIRKIHNGWAYIVSGRGVIKLELINGKFIFIGTHLNLDKLKSELIELNYEV